MSDTNSSIAAHFESSFRQALGALTGRDYTLTPAEKPLVPPASDTPILWQQSFSGFEGPSMWISAGRDLWETMARVTLEAAGLDEVTDSDARSTWQEILGQTISGIASAITADLLREVNAGKGEELAAEPPGLDWRYFTVADSQPDGGGGPWVIRAAWVPSLGVVNEPKTAEVRERTSGDTSSKTFELLLDVSLPVSVSFGKTSLQIREVLKLNTGSIVELNRFVTDPVEVVVNDCVIARGEVVVVDGNYGVRINHLATREDRLRTGLAEHHKVGAKP